MAVNKKLSLRELCEHSGLRLTRQRRLLLSILDGSGRHLSAYAVFKQARQADKTIGQATVYRTLKVLAERGILDTHSFGSGENLFESLEKAHHDHFVCDVCGSITEFYSEELEKIKVNEAKANKFHMESHRLDIHGTCHACHVKKKKD